MRLHLHQLDQAGATAGQVVTWDNTNLKWVAANPPATGLVDPSTTKGDLLARSATAVDRLPVGTNGQVLLADSTQPLGVKWGSAPAATNGVPIGGAAGQVLTKNSATDYDTTWATPSPSGGGSPDGKPAGLATPPATTGAKDDEFNDAASMSGPVNGLAAKWSKHNLATASWLALDDTKAPGSLLFDIPSGAAADQAIYQPVPSGDFRLQAGLQWNNYTGAGRQIWALLVVDSAGTGVCVWLDVNSGGSLSPYAQMGTVSAWAVGAGTAACSNSDVGITEYENGRPVHIALRKAGGVYYGASAAGQRRLMFGAWGETAYTPAAFTPAYISFGRIFGTVPSKVTLDYFRVT